MLAKSLSSVSESPLRLAVPVMIRKSSLMIFMVVYDMVVLFEQERSSELFVCDNMDD